MRDFNKNLLEDQKAETREIFGSYKKFKKRLEATFEDPDEECTAERKLYFFQQATLMASYILEFY